MMFLSPELYDEQIRREIAEGRDAVEAYVPVYVPPLLIVESLSKRHENHDRMTKRAWYAEFGVPNYWLLAAHERSLVCLRLSGDHYVVDAEGRDADEVRVAAFDGLTVRLSDLWQGPRRT